MGILQQLEQQQHLNQQDMKAFIDLMINPQIENQIKYKALKSYTEKEMQQTELTFLAQSLIKTMYKEQPVYEGSMCICGTGGDRSGSFNISTTASFVVASAGSSIIKHGNKSITSNSGSTDLLDQLNIKTTPVKDVTQQLNRYHLAFVSATESYPIMKYIQPIRKMITKPTIFNLVGPLINPFKLTYQTMGIYDRSQLANVAQTVKDLGRKKAVVIHGAGGMDEASLSGDNLIYEVNAGQDIQHYTINAKDFGLKNTANDTLKGGTPEENKAIAVNILNGQDHSSKRDVVVLNAGIALYVSEKVNDIATGVQLAQQLIDDGTAMKQYLRMVEN
ncbi:anthranilate phosphoribosyltransferase [Staphylococcus warneri]|uniref:anthranilate phosphoribosyltransferase n=1 Tax=Staphylococcus warneri TaxID=1292 RepID=UPI00066A1AEB|nr:anthranilate phosphoribosyltransferase [Staphylococcus warneri]MBY6181245.1 anthranilate phosphoribosyltransferase [Staphylococcaceae bacterium DP2N0-1]